MPFSSPIHPLRNPLPPQNRRPATRSKKNPPPQDRRSPFPRLYYSQNSPYPTLPQLHTISSHILKQILPTYPHSLSLHTMHIPSTQHRNQSRKALLTSHTQTSTQLPLQSQHFSTPTKSSPLAQTMNILSFSIQINPCLSPLLQALHKIPTTTHSPHIRYLFPLAPLSAGAL